MNLRSLIVSSLLSISFGANAATQVAPANRVNLFLDSTTPFTSSDWINATSTTIGSVKVLKSTGNTTYQLLLNLPSNVGIEASGKKFRLDAVSYFGSSQARIYDTANTANTKGQCVDFAKSMIGSTDTTSTWHAGTKLSDIPVNQRATVLRPGTMIAHFTGQTIYNSSSNTQPHVAIVLSVASDGSGVNVVDQNFANGFTLKVGTTPYVANSSNTLIAKHLMPWTDSSPRRAAGEYHIVDLYGVRFTNNPYKYPYNFQITLFSILLLRKYRGWKKFIPFHAMWKGFLKNSFDKKDSIRTIKPYE